MNKKGGALISALFAAAVLLILMTALMGTRLTEMRAITGTISSSRAQLLAEAGVEYTLASIIRDQGEVPDSLPYTFSSVAYAGGQFQASLSQGSGGRLIIKSIGTDASGRQRAVEAQLELSNYNPITDFALLSCGNVEIAGSSRVTGGDVYASGKLTLESSTALSGGDGLARGNVEFYSDGFVDGSVTSKTGNIIAGGSGVRVTGTAANPSGNITLSSTQAGSISHDPNLWNIPDYCESPWFDAYQVTDSDFNRYKSDAQAVSSFSGDVTMNNGHTGSYGGQRFIDGNVDIKGTPGWFELSGVYYVTGNLTISSNYKGKASFIVEGDIIFNGTPQAEAADEEQHAYITKGNVRLTGTPYIDGTVYARDNFYGSGSAFINGSMVVHGNTDLTGSYELTHRKLERPFVKTTLDDITIVRWRNVSP